MSVQSAQLPQNRYMKYQNDILGVGSFKRVYKCIDVFTGIEYAWNEINMEKMEPLSSTKVFQEIMMYKRCSHQNILRIYDYWFSDDNLLIFTTEMQTGGSLYQYIHKINTNITLSVIQKWALQILKAIEYLHKNNIIHRDLKSQNVYIDQSTGDVCIGDLGLATTLDLTSIDMDKYNQSMVGTTEFMAPEMFKQAYNTKVDIFSFGMLLIEITTNECPYQECKHTLEIYDKIVKGIPPECVNKITNPYLRDLVNQCINVDQQARYTAVEAQQHSFFSTTFPEETTFYKQNMQVSKSNTEQQITSHAGINDVIQQTKSSQEQVKQSVVQNGGHDTKNQAEQKLKIVIGKRQENGQVETFSITIHYFQNDVQQKTTFVISKNDESQDVLQTLIDLNEEFASYQNQLESRLKDLFTVWQTRGLKVDDVFE